MQKLQINLQKTPTAIGRRIVRIRYLSFYMSLTVLPHEGQAGEK